MTKARIIPPETSQDIDAVQKLCWDYRDYLIGLSPFDAQLIELFYPQDKYAALMDRVAEEHAPPTGLIRLAKLGEAPVGCGMVHSLPDGSAEIKRVYVTEAARGTGTGYAIMNALIEGCRDLGFERILMDTSKPLEAAQRLYLSMGFKRRGPYQDVPPIAEGHMLYFEMDLS
ncbi:GNAT family N-acetyltransferase [Salibaculum griseiflavum]|uniref:N-acetyltransferase n=1 Tax=Salibaculum griseiflavum TaxID=1914409 RepID=A0A2V1P219_9RHOB|nr:GNAT family N-acetyltransferase [Salibaculum griseiflavum]PWG16366.1 N-acetyltransferase [Salibaculum griseiflavum]